MTEGQAFQSPLDGVQRTPERKPVKTGPLTTDAQHTERACDRCRERRVKCDKTIPTCLRCEKFGKPCPGYDKKRKFVDEGETLRKKYQASPGPTLGRDVVQSRTGTETPDVSPKHHLSQIQFNDVASDAVADGPSIGPVDHDTTDQVFQSAPIGAPLGLDAAFLPSVASIIDPTQLFDSNLRLPVLLHDSSPAEPVDNVTYDPAWFDLDPDEFYQRGNNSCGFIPNAPIVDEVDRQDLQPSIESVVETPISLVGSAGTGCGWPPDSQARTSAIVNDERAHEMAYLIRHFTESLGPWMDLFDCHQHYAHFVPLRALRDALLRNAVAAVAAKQLGRTNGVKPFLGHQCQKPATMEVMSPAAEVDWFYKAANYYDKAIAFSREYLQTICEAFNGPDNPPSRQIPGASDSDDLLVAVSIFSLYESLDNREFGWLPHLEGFKSLLSTINAREQCQMTLRPALSPGRKASFWNFARMDYQAAYTNGQKTYLDTEDIQLWRTSGLEIQPDGSLFRDVAELQADTLHCQQVAELVAHTVLWLVLRVVNYLTLSKHLGYTSSQAMWDTLNAQLDAWYSAKPSSFTPCAQVRYPLEVHPKRNASATPTLTEVFFSISQCAAAMQLYHFARIILLMNQPKAFVDPSNRQKAYRKVSPAAFQHARDIISIALGRPAAAVRVEMLLPLYIAGLCLEAQEERQVVLDVIRAIEKDTGCSTEVTARSLVDAWGWSQEP